MWLPKDERRLLAGYYRNIDEIAKKKQYRVTDLRPLLACRRIPPKIPEYGDAAQHSDDGTGDTKSWAKKYFDETNRIEIANRHLNERGLIALEPHRYESEVVGITLTVDGYDLGRKCAGCLTCSGLWFEEYRNHWLWLIAAFFGGAVGTKLLDFIVARVTSGRNP